MGLLKEKEMYISVKFRWQPETKPLAGRCPQLDYTIIVARGQRGNGLAVTHLINRTLMSRKGKERMVNGPIPNSFGSKPNEQSVIRWRCDDQLVIITGKTAVRIPFISNEMPWGSQLHLACWPLLLLLRCWDVVDNGVTSTRSAKQTTSFSVESCTYNFRSVVERIKASEF